MLLGVHTSWYRTRSVICFAAAHRPVLNHSHSIWCLTHTSPSFFHNAQIISAEKALLAQLIASPTASMRFDGEVNVVITEFLAKLVPYSRMHMTRCCHGPSSRQSLLFAQHQLPPKRSLAPPGVWSPQHWRCKSSCRGVHLTRACCELCRCRCGGARRTCAGLQQKQVMHLQRRLLCSCTQRLRCTQHWHQPWSTSPQSSSAVHRLELPSLGLHVCAFFFESN